jgi:hypothetical protein
MTFVLVLVLLMNDLIIGTGTCTVVRLCGIGIIMAIIWSLWQLIRFFVYRALDGPMEPYIRQHGPIEPKPKNHAY